MHPFPELSTEHLILNKFGSSDIPELFTIFKDPVYAQRTLNIPYPYTEADGIAWSRHIHEQFLLGNHYSFAIRQKGDPKLIGSIALMINQRFDRGELGYWLAKEHWNKGYMTEATKAIIEFGFEILQLNKILATHLTSNPASGAVMLKCGMVWEAELKQHTKKGTVYHDHIQYRILKSDYLKNS